MATTMHESSAAVTALSAPRRSASPSCASVSAADGFSERFAQDMVARAPGATAAPAAAPAAGATVAPVAHVQQPG
jgi:hypothetical protein